ncbi:O-antigen polysaccharide polymerase Wzy [Cohnella rhizosphaerae]|uniref:O-antigen polysaccharide polymerase Wzy family protein n=1 Tax=Cohnella rhizosphaerae TaxID=1457232 RepID=A0A9X4L1J5_9BACL|nr:O-antigen polysaccharide polymerase Wzy [Cohnella rhizosphaerae]MDG0811839.1 O-antigen polysaccharide polymerase Wzy family protein [Cohnella rhizosphaerae]
MSSYIDPIFEMGSSMNVLGILLMDKIHDTWGFGSTYIPAILGMVLPRVKTWFGYPDMYVENWLSQDYLGLDHYGVGFSIIGEAYLNFGIYIAPFAMLVMGYLLGSLLYFDAKSSLKNLFRIFVIVTSTSTFTGYARGSLTYHARMWFWGTLLICLVVILLTLVASRYKGNSTHPLDGDMKILG